jgi:hypothetical protein
MSANSRKNKSRDTSTPMPDNVCTFMGIIRSACGGFRYNIEILKQNEAREWCTQPAQAILRGSMHKQFFRKDLPATLTERLILIESTELGKLSSDNDPNSTKKKNVIILYCYTKDEIKDMDREGKLPPNFISYTDSNKVATGEKINLNDDNNIIDFDDSTNDTFLEYDNDANNDDAENQEDENSTDDELNNNNRDLTIDINASFKKNKGKNSSSSNNKKTVKKKKKSSNSRNGGGGGSGWFDSI